jgi:hypothetical protein
MLFQQLTVTAKKEDEGESSALVRENEDRNNRMEEKR